MPRVVLGDAEDDHVIAAAVAGDAELIASGDSDLLGIGSHLGIGLVAAAEAVIQLDAGFEPNRVE